MKKKLVLRKEVKLILVLIATLIMAIIILQSIENKNYNDALKRCNNNVITKYTNTGDKYYVCKESE